MSTITIIQGGSKEQRFNRLTNECKSQWQSNAAVSIWTEMVNIAQVMNMLNLHGYAAIHEFQQPSYASYLPYMLKAFALHGKPVMLTVNHPQDIPAELAGHYTLIDLDK